jgi:hypothetical protein
MIPGVITGLVVFRLAHRSALSTAGAAADNLVNFGGLCAWILVRPDPDNLPPSLGQTHVRIGVAPTIRLDLASPPVGVGLRPGGMFGAAVPEAPIDEDRNACLCENHVGFAAETTERSQVNPESQPAAMKLRA